MRVHKGGIHLKVSNIYASLNFYRLFGLKPVFSYGTDKFFSAAKLGKITTAKEKYNGVVFDLNGMIFEIADGHLAVKEEVFKAKMQSSKISLLLDVDSVNEVAEIAHTEKIKISVPITEFPWGSKEIVIKDPDEVVVVFRELLVE